MIRKTGMSIVEDGSSIKKVTYVISKDAKSLTDDISQRKEIFQNSTTLMEEDLTFRTYVGSMIKISREK